MDDAGQPPETLTTSDVPKIPPEIRHEVETLVSAEVQKQLDRERNIIKDAGSLALKIIGGAFALLLGIFGVFSLTTWKDIAKEAT
jgi:hypothetical protein